MQRLDHGWFGRSRPRVLAVSMAVAAVLAFAAGCGGSNDAAAGAGATAMSRDDAALAFARCMREQGMEVSDPSRRGGGVRLALRPGDETRFREAEATCRKKVPGAFQEPSAEDLQRFQDAALRFARCMRSHGVDVPDPQPNGRGLIIRGPAPKERDDERFRAAEKACQRLTPRLDGAEEESP